METKTHGNRDLLYKRIYKGEQFTMFFTIEHISRIGFLTLSRLSSRMRRSRAGPRGSSTKESRNEEGGASDSA